MICIINRKTSSNTLTPAEAEPITIGEVSDDASSSAAAEDPKKGPTAKLAQWIRNQRKSVLTQHFNIPFCESFHSMEVWKVELMQMFGAFMSKEISLAEYLFVDSIIAQRKGDLVKKLLDKKPEKLKEFFADAIGKNQSLFRS
jgi:hypothetical protein